MTEREGAGTQGHGDHGRAAAVRRHTAIGMATPGQSRAQGCQIQKIFSREKTPERSLIELDIPLNWAKLKNGSGRDQ
jgi:hypothetical protein